MTPIDRWVGHKIGHSKSDSFRCELESESWLQCEKPTVWRSFRLECASEVCGKIRRTNYVHEALRGSHRPMLRPVSTGSRNAAAWA